MIREGYAQAGYGLLGFVAVARPKWATSPARGRAATAQLVVHAGRVAFGTGFLDFFNTFEGLPGGDKIQCGCLPEGDKKIL